MLGEEEKCTQSFDRNEEKDTSFLNLDVGGRIILKEIIRTQHKTAWTGLI